MTVISSTCSSTGSWYGGGGAGGDSGDGGSPGGGTEGGKGGDVGGSAVAWCGHDASTSAWLEDGVLACINAITEEPAILEELRSDRLLVALVGAASRHPESHRTMEAAAAVIERLDAASPTSARFAAVMAQAEARAQASVHLFGQSLFGARMRARRRS